MTKLIEDAEKIAKQRKELKLLVPNKFQPLPEFIDEEVVVN